MRGRRARAAPGTGEGRRAAWRASNAVRTDGTSNARTHAQKGHQETLRDLHSIESSLEGRRHGLGGASDLVAKGRTRAQVNLISELQFFESQWRDIGIVCGTSGVGERRAEGHLMRASDLLPIES